MNTPSGYVDTLPTEVKRRVRALKNLQTRHGELEAKFREEQLKLERKFNDLYAPLYTRRTEIISGSVEPTDEECEREVSDVEDSVAEASIQELDAEGGAKQDEEKVKGASSFACVHTSTPSPLHTTASSHRPRAYRETRIRIRTRPHHAPSRCARVLGDRAQDAPGGGPDHHPRGRAGAGQPLRRAHALP